MPLSFVTSAVGCEECRSAITTHTDERDPVYEIEEGGHQVFAGLVERLADLDQIFAGVATCHTVRGMVIGETDQDAAFVIDRRGFRWTFRWDR